METVPLDPPGPGPFQVQLDPFNTADNQPFIGTLSDALYSACKNDVILAYRWSIKMYTGLPLVT